MTSARLTPGATDVLVAGATGAVTVGALLCAPLLLGPEAPPTDGLAFRATGVALVAQAVALLGAGRAPRAVLGVVAALAALVGLAFPTGLGNLTDAAVMVAVVRACLRPAAPVRVLLPVVGVLVAVGQAGDPAGSGALPWAAAVGAGVLQAVVVVALPAVAVLAVTARHEARRARDGELAAVLREREATVRAAVADERTAMARDLHDIAAHHVSGIALMAAAADRLVETDPVAARDATRRIREQSRSLLDDLRRLVGLLRESGAATESVQTVATVPDLVEHARAAGLDVVLRTGHDGEGLGPLAQLVAYRVVQEALANAARHAPGSVCTVDVGAGEGPADRFVVTVRSGPGPASGPSPVARPGTGQGTTGGGFGLLGMRERAALVGGSLDAGPEPGPGTGPDGTPVAGGGWTVRLTLPLHPTVPTDTLQTDTATTAAVPRGRG